MSSFGLPVYPEAGWVPHTVVFASGEDSLCVPLANEGVGFGLLLLALLPLALPCGLVCFGGFAVIFFSPGRFHALVFHAWRVASGSSGSRTSRYGLLVYVQGASDSLPHSSPGGEVVASGFWHDGTGVAPGNVPSSWHGCLPGAGSECVRLYLLRIATQSLRFLF